MNERRKGSRGIDNELVKSYNDYLAKTRKAKHLESFDLKRNENAELQLSTPLDHAVEKIKSNFNRLRVDFESTLSALEEQYIIQYQQFTDLKSIIDAEKQSILTKELQAERAAFSSEIEKEKKALQHEKQRLEQRKQDFDREQQVYFLNVDLSRKKAAESLEKEQKDFEILMENKRMHLEQEQFNQKRAAEEEIEKNKQKIEEVRKHCQER